jgi:hypothetical protein
VFPCELVQAAHEVLAHRGGVCRVFMLHEVQGGDGGCTGYRVPAIGVAVSTTRPALHQAPAGHHRTDGEAGPEPLGQSHDVGLYALVLTGEHPAGPSDARLHLVEDQQDAVPVAEFAQPGQEPGRRHDVTALALDRLDQDGGDLARRNTPLEQHVDVIEHRTPLVLAGKERPIGVRVRHVRHTRHRGRKAFLLRVFTGSE